MKPDGSLPCSQVPASAACTEPNESNAQAHLTFFSDPFCQDLRLGFTSGRFHLEFANTDTYARPTHLILLDFDPSFGKELKLRGSSLCRFESKTF
jgi:hypothetical protein